MKHLACQAHPRTAGEVYDAFGEGLRRITASDIDGWFRHRAA